MGCRSRVLGRHAAGPPLLRFHRRAAAQHRRRAHAADAEPKHPGCAKEEGELDFHGTRARRVGRARDRRAAAETAGFWGRAAAERPGGGRRRRGSHHLAAGRRRPLAEEGHRAGDGRRAAAELVPAVAELHDLVRNCAAAGLNTKLIRDAGHTEIEPGSRTVLAVGPAPASALDPITRHLKPY